MRRSDLVPECGSCAAICCIATSFDASEDFAFDKAAGVACRHVTRDHRCAVHAELEVRGLSGCAAYDCHGAGQRVTRAFAGSTQGAAARDEAFLILRVVHELIWLLTEAAKLCPTSHEDLRRLIEREIEALDAIEPRPAAGRLDVDLRPHQAAARALLRRVGDALGGRRGPLAVID